LEEIKKKNGLDAKLHQITSGKDDASSDLKIKDLNEEILVKIKDTFVKTQVDATKERDLDGIKSFEVRKVSGTTYMALPSNIEELCASNYLYKLLILANSHNKIQGVTSGVKHDDTIGKNDDITSFLHGFGVILVEGKLIKKPKLKGMFGRGLSCAVKYAIGSIKNADVSLLKLMKVSSAPEVVFKDPWGKKHITEKRLLDNVIAAIKRVEKPWESVKTWILPLEEIKKKNGLDAKLHQNSLIDEVERKYILKDFKEELKAVDALLPADIEVKERKSLSMSSLPDTKIDSILSYSDHVRSVIKLFKPYKDFVNDLLSLRLKCVYGHKDNTQLKRRKKPIHDLINNIKKTREFVTSFNIGRGMRVHPPFIVTYYPTSEGEYNTLRKQLDEWLAKFSAEDDMSVRAGLNQKWLIAAISD